MSCEQNTILVENAWEAFICEYERNTEYRTLIHENYFTAAQQWYIKEFGGKHEDRALEDTFHFLLEEDFEAVCENVIDFSYRYYKEFYNKKVE